MSKQRIKYWRHLKPQLSNIRKHCHVFTNWKCLIRNKHYWLNYLHRHPGNLLGHHQTWVKQSGSVYTIAERECSFTHSYLDDTTTLLSNWSPSACVPQSRCRSEIAVKHILNDPPALLITAGPLKAYTHTHTEIVTQIC